MDFDSYAYKNDRSHVLMLCGENTQYIENLTAYAENLAAYVERIHTKIRFLKQENKRLKKSVEEIPKLEARLKHVEEICFNMKNK